MDKATTDELGINTLRFLAVDAVQNARNGHPGTPMGASAMAYALWDRHLKHNPVNPDWPDRDRFILSPGHASTLLYGLLHLYGYDVSLDDIKNFRQWESQTPGHPEHGVTPGVEATTGPLGQGVANGVGMAITERLLASHYNREGHTVVDHNTYAIVSDGDLQEGVAAEAASLAGTLKLGKLIYLYDDNDISIEGNTDIAFAENVAQRFQAYGWHVQGPIDGMDVEAVDACITNARAETTRPSLIICRTIIGYGSPNKQGTASAHGEPLGEDEVRLTKENLGWPHTEPFSIPQEALAHYREAVQRGQKAQEDWDSRMEAFRAADPNEARHLEEALSGELPEGWDADLDSLFSPEDKPMATRESSGVVMNGVAKRVHTLTGGSADLAPSTKTLLKDQGASGIHDHGHYGFETYLDHNMHFGVREHAMGAIANGMSLHGGTIPYTATFLIFSDYMRPPIRLAALMNQGVIFIFTHDSIGLGADGPTHQPIEQLASLRAIPNVTVLRPADATETVEAWRVAIERRDGPTVLALSRQNLPILDRTTLAPSEGARRGGYVLWESSPVPDAILLGTGSEVAIALEAGKLLQEAGVNSRVVSLPSWELFDAQDAAYRQSVLPPSVRARVSMEAGSTMGWKRFVGEEGIAIGVDHFGASAPADVLYEKFGLTARHMADEALRLVRGGN